jgi:hypothetical protein
MTVILTFPMTVILSEVDRNAINVVEGPAVVLAFAFLS